MNDSEIEQVDLNTDFGSLLSKARKAKGYSVDLVSEQLKIPARMITALEENDLETLPASTFTQGYIRAYAKFLLISEEEVLSVYHNAVPREEASTLKPRSTLPGEASSQSPLVKLVTFTLLLAGIAAIIYGSYNYYIQKADVMGDVLGSRESNFTGNSLDSPGKQRLEIKQNARMTEDGELILTLPKSQQTNPSAETEKNTVGLAQSLQPAQNEVVGATEVEETVTEEITAAADDVLEIIADEGSWMEVKDASKERLFYNMVPRGGTKVITGKAPFRISMGNAGTTRIIVNDLEVDVSALIRANNTATFAVSTQGQSLVFH